MATNIPAKLKALDINRFAHRAAQVEKVKPAIAYWCYYWILTQIITKKLQSADAECTEYTSQIMDTVEKMKTQYANDDAILDDLAGQAYVEQFGSETFQRADNAMRANKSSRQTADTLQASATFLDLLQIWSALNEETAAKVKFAKFHALRIAKALKAGEDPNIGNPAPEPVPEDIELDPNDPEVQRINDASNHHPSVEDVADDSPYPPPGPSHHPVSPLAPPSAPSNHDIQNSGYFPEVSPEPTPSSQESSATPAPPPVSSYPSHPASRQVPAAIVPLATPAVVSTPSVIATTSNGSDVVDDAAVALAQKHARWAISALNFEDSKTAISELRLALQALGAQ